MLDSLAQDLRYALRRLRREPAFAAAAILTIGLAVGLNTAIFSVTNAVLLRPLPYADPDRLVLAGKTYQDDTRPSSLTEVEYDAWRERNDVFEGMAASYAWDVDYITSGVAEPIRGAKITASLLPLFGVTPILGRTFSPEEEQPGRDAVVILSERLWRRLFAADRRILGRRIRLDLLGKPQTYEIVGVMPAEFRFSYETSGKQGQATPRSGADVFAPATHGQWWSGGGTYARLRRGVSVAQARAAMRDLQVRLNQELRRISPWLGSWISQTTVTILPLHEATFGDTRPAFLMLTLAVALVLLVGCTNVANLLLARDGARQQELAIRVALGSDRRRLFRQLLTENLALAFLGGLAGLVLAAWGTRALAQLVPSEFARGDEIGVDRAVFGFAALISLATGVLFGLLPALRASNPRIGETLKVGGGAGARSPGRLRGALVAGQVMMVLVLLAGAGLMLNSVWRLVSTTPGFAARRLMSMQMRPSSSTCGDPARHFTFNQALLARVRAIQGILDAATTTDVPFGSGGVNGFVLPGADPRPRWAEFYVVEPEYLRMLQLLPLRGRLLAEADQRGRPVAAINTALADRYFANTDPLGQSVAVGAVTFQIVGVVANHREMMRRQGLRLRFASDPNAQRIQVMEAPALYIPSGQRTWTWCLSYLIVQTRSDPRGLTNRIRQAIAALDPALAVKEAVTFEDWIALPAAETRFYAVVLATFAFVALVLAAVGIYGVLAQTVGQRVREIGIRMALGATSGRIVRMVLSQTIALVGLGVAVGLLAAWWATRLVRGFLFGVTPTDPLTFAAVVFLLVLVAAGAAWLPARRATRVDPMRALRWE